MYDEHKEKIEELYKLGLSVQKIVKYIGVGTQPSLRSWIISRLNIINKLLI